MIYINKKGYMWIVICNSFGCFYFKFNCYVFIEFFVGVIFSVIKIIFYEDVLLFFIFIGIFKFNICKVIFEFVVENGDWVLLDNCDVW